MMMEKMNRNEPDEKMMEKMLEKMMERRFEAGALNALCARSSDDGKKQKQRLKPVKSIEYSRSTAVM